MSWALPIAGSIVGGLISKSGSDSNASAIEQSGSATAAASKYASDQQYKAFQEQQANQNTKYGQSLGDLASLFGGNINQSLTGADAGTGVATGNLFGSNTGLNDPQLQAYLTQLQQQATGYGNTGTDQLSAFNNFSPTAANDPNLQALLAQLRGTGGAFNSTANNQLDLFNSFNPQTMAQSIYDKLALLGQPQREQDRANLESRLLNQGILTASPGYSQINSFDQAAGQTDLARQIQAMLTAQQQQQQYAINATQFGQAGAALGGQAQEYASASRAEDAARQQQYLQNALGLGSAVSNLAGTSSNLKNAALSPALQAASIAAGVPVNSAQPIPTGELGVAGAQAAGQANVAAANIRNSFWSSLGSNAGFQSGINAIATNLFNTGNNGYGMSSNYTGPELNGANGLFAQVNGYGGGV